MVLLRRIEIAGFRGAIGPLLVDLSSGCRSIAVFGENATGKSSLTDAVEWFYTERVDHLWRENCKESALRNALLPENEASSVSLQFSDNRLDCTKTLSSSFESGYSNSSIDFQD